MNDQNAAIASLPNTHETVTAVIDVHAVRSQRSRVVIVEAVTSALDRAEEAEGALRRAEAEINQLWKLMEGRDSVEEALERQLATVREECDGLRRRLEEVEVGGCALVQ